jgi:hypothetical protein
LRVLEYDAFSWEVKKTKEGQQVEIIVASTANYWTRGQNGI